MRKFAAAALLTLTIATTADAAARTSRPRSRDDEGALTRVTRVVKRLLRLETTVDRPVKPVPVTDDPTTDPVQ